MSEINIKISELDAAITNLQSLKSACDGINTIAPTTVGGGKTVNEIENIASVYKSLNIHVGDMISNTISFMQNIEPVSLQVIVMRPERLMANKAVK